MSHDKRRPASGTPGTPSDHVGLLAAAALMMVLGYGGLTWLITQSLPRIGGELWLFFVLLLLAVSGTALPIVRYLNVRFTPLEREVPPSGVIVRQSIWVGLFVVTCAWLQIPRLLNVALAALIALLLLGTELFIRSRELAAEREER
ncbi:MAG: hypothetical protein NZ750_02755 [Anaerolineae bacterium]|nr:hypothetical protein [Anaerolineae bacterium]MDW8173400.1 hypothetical protein [Anaerolineae bacterium]